MKLFEASIKDDEDIKTFFNDQIVSGIYDYKVVRPNSFFDQYKLTTQDYVTYLLRDSENKIHATTSLLFKKGYINHKEQTIGYVTDLRVSKSREATLSWPKVFVPALEEARKNRNCEFVFSDIEQFESKAYNLLLRRRNRTTKLPRYHLFQKFYLVVVYGKKFFADEPLPSIKINYGRTEDIEPLCHYLLEKSVRRPLRYHLTPDELERRCLRWPNFSIQNFLIARNREGNIIGCMAPWNNRDVQRVMPCHYHGKSLQIYSTSRILSPIKLMRPMPHKGDYFSVKHITHSAYDNPDIFYSLLNHAYEDCQSSELLIYPNYLGDFTTRPPLSFITEKIPHGFYTVLDSDKKLPSYLHPNPFYPSPDFQYCYF